MEEKTHEAIFVILRIKLLMFIEFVNKISKIWGIAPRYEK